jgi:antitoxin CptB
MACPSRLYWRCRRGMLELDLLLEGFLERGYGELRPHQREHFEKLIELPDAQLFDLLLGAEQSDNRDVADVIEKICRAAAP